jgi:hypothetical protein
MTDIGRDLPGREIEIQPLRIPITPREPAPEPEPAREPVKTPEREPIPA